LIAAGQSIGNYRILSKIGTGGMGAVYLAEHPLIGKKVALKVIHRELASNKEVVQRFFQEARACNQIGNEHIVAIHDFGVTPDGDHFYIMEYLEGKTLASLLAKHTALDVMRSLHIGAQIASALSAAHVAGIIHRDLKPDNIMLMKLLGDPDFVKVLDFGLAKVFAAGASAVKTAAGVLLGTPQYMSPEACESKAPVDHRTDIYALGILLFQMMTGVLPFDGESMGEVLVKQVTALPPAPRGLNPNIPPSVEQILLRCLAKPVGNRFQSMLALREALLDPEAYLHTSPPIAPARSVAPGEARVDARTVMAHAAMLEAQKQAAQKPGDGHLAATVIGMSYGDQPPRVVSEALRDLAPPTVPTNNTMRIGTPYGYTSRPPRKMWPIVLVFGLILGLIGGAIAVVMAGGGGDEMTIVTAPSGSDSAVASGGGSGSETKPGSAATGSGASVGSGSAGRGSASAGRGSAAGSGSATAPIQASAKLVLESQPTGASVFDETGKLLGKTRLELEWPVSTTPVTFELRLTGYKKKLKQLVVDGEMNVGVDLEKGRTPATPRRGSARNSGSARGSGNGLIRPE
jgi:serine/threonine-protein kinase